MMSIFMLTAQTPSDCGKQRPTGQPTDQPNLLLKCLCVKSELTEEVPYTVNGKI